MTYDLRADIRRVLDATSLVDPGEVADKVAESIPAKALRAALRVTLRSYVRVVMNEQRHSSDSAGGHTGSVAGRSTKVRAIRDGWQRQLDSRVHVGESKWKFLGDCTYENLQTIAAERDWHVTRNQAWARYYRDLASLLTEHDVATVRDLPAQVLMPALGGVA